MTKFEVLLVVKDEAAVKERISGQGNINVHTAPDEEQAIEQMQAVQMDIVVYEGNSNFAERNKLKSLKNILAPGAVLIEFDMRNISALPDDLEMAMQQINASLDGGAKYFDGV